MAQATLRTSRLTLLPLGPEHREDEVDLDSDPQVMRYLFNGRPRPRADVLRSHDRRLQVAKDHPGLGFWAGSADGVFVGWWLLEPVPAEGSPRVAELGYRLLPRFWRRGLASEGSVELVRHGFADLGLDRVIAQTMAVNEGSRATMARVGLRHVRTFHEHHDEPIAGFEQGEVEYAITRDEWLARPPGS